MLKKKWKTLLLITILSFLLIFHFNVSFATDTNVVTENETVTNSEDTSAEEGVEAISSEESSDTTTGEEDTTSTEEQDIYEDDLYIIDDNVVMDKLVDGNVYILGNTVEITGPVNGNLYVCANTLTFSGSYIRYSIFACANTIEFDGACNDLYALCNSMNVTYDSYIVRDVRIGASSLNFIGAVGRNAHIFADNLSFGEDGSDQLALIYGNLNYISPSEITVPDGVVEGEINYTAIENTNKEVSTTTMIFDYLISLVKCLVYTFVVFFLMLWLTPKFAKKSASFVSGKMGIGLAIGIVSAIAAVIISLLLLASVVATPVAFAFITGYGLLASFGLAVVSICFAHKFAKNGSLGKKLGMLAIVTIIIWALTQIPYIGGYIWILVTCTGLGTLLYYSFTKHKDDTKVEENTPTKE